MDLAIKIIFGFLFIGFYPVVTSFLYLQDKEMKACKNYYNVDLGISLIGIFALARLTLLSFMKIFITEMTWEKVFMPSLLIYIIGMILYLVFYHDIID